MNTEHLDPAMETHAAALDHHPDYRVLRRVPAPYSNVPQGAPPSTRCVAIVDLETSGLDPDEDKIIELALMLAWVDDEGRILNHTPPRVWREDPGVPLAPEIKRLTGLTDEDLAGQAIDDDMVLALLRRADLLIAHNASFEIAWLERHYPELRGAAWACSMRDVDWLVAGFDGRAQQHLLAQTGWFSDAHRADLDVWSLFWLARQVGADSIGDRERSHMSRLLKGADRSTVLVQAKGAPFAAKDWLRGRGYRWNAPEKCWQKEFEPGLVEHEEAQLDGRRCPPPILTPITARQRHR